MSATEDVVVLKRESYRRGQERQRVAEALKNAAEEERERAYVWARDCREEERKAWKRATYLYGLAASLGASVEQLAGPSRKEPK